MANLLLPNPNCFFFSFSAIALLLLWSNNNHTTKKKSLFFLLNYTVNGGFFTLTNLYIEVKSFFSQNQTFFKKKIVNFFSRNQYCTHIHLCEQNTLFLSLSLSSRFTRTRTRIHEYIYSYSAAVILPLCIQFSISGSLGFVFYCRTEALLALSNRTPFLPSDSVFSKPLLGEHRVLIRSYFFPMFVSLVLGVLYFE